MSFPHIFKLNDALNKSILNQILTDGKINDVQIVFKVLQPEEISVHTFKAKGWSFIERLWTPSWPRGRLTVASVPTDDCPCWRRRRLKPELPISTTEGKCYQKIIAPQQQPFSQFPLPFYVLRIRYLTGDTQVTLSTCLGSRLRENIAFVGQQELGF